jgi:D-arginine dehydrogenase
MVARGDQMERLRRAYEEWARLVPSIQLLEGDSARNATPMLKPDYVAGAVVDAGASDLDVNEIHRGFLRGAARAGAKLVCNAEVSALGRDGAGWRVQTKAGEFAGRVVVNAAGAWGDEIGVLAGARPVGLVPKRRTAVLFDPAPAADVRVWPIIIDADEQFYFKPDAGRLLGSPADETASPPCDAQPEEIDVAIAVNVYCVNGPGFAALSRTSRLWSASIQNCPAFFGWSLRAATESRLHPHLAASPPPLPVA